MGTDWTNWAVPAHADPHVVRRVRELAADYAEQTRTYTGDWPTQDHDPDWPSPCIVGEPADGVCRWQPAPMQPATDLVRLGAALETDLHAAWYGIFLAQWSASLPLEFGDGAFELLQLWNEADADNVVGNQIGHALEKRRIRQPLTLFIGLIDDNQLLSIDNDSGAVMLEALGQPRPHEVAPSVPSFLADCRIPQINPT